MIKQTVKYEDFNGNFVTKELYFHLRKIDLIDMEITEGISMSERMRRMTQTDNAVEVKNLLKRVVLDAYGERTPDGRFVKTRAIRDEFEQSEAYSEFMWSLLSNPSKAAEFMTILIPKNMIEEVVKNDPDTLERMRQSLREAGVEEEKASDIIKGLTLKSTNETPAVGASYQETGLENTEEATPSDIFESPVSGAAESEPMHQPAPVLPEGFDPSTASREEIQEFVDQLNANRPQ